MRRGIFLALAVLAVLQGAAVAKLNVQLTDKLVELIRKKSYEPFTEELSKHEVDVNQPDSKGRLPLLEAVRTKDVRFVDALLQYGALAKSKDPATGATPLHVAFQQNMKDIARHLLAYGADPNADDKSNKKARDFAPSKEIRDLIVAYDKDGPMAFEDEPGTWIHDNKGAKEHYWFNSKTQESRWNTPPSCAWHPVHVQGHPAKYVNTVTGQETLTVPRALAWAKLIKDGKPLWYNWRDNFTQVDTPQEPPKEVLDVIEKNVNVRWYNPKTKEFSWQDPVYSTSWREVKEEGSDKTFFYNIETGTTTWEVPAEMAWVKQEHENGTPYYFNRITGDSVWEAPDHMAWVRHDTDL